MIRYRTMDTSDYEGAYALWTSCKSMGLNNLDDSSEGIARFLARNPSTCFVALDGEAVAGVVLAGHDGRRGYIYHTAVGEAWRRRGVGAELVSLCLDALKAEGIHKVALVAFTRNESGNAFWQRMGFNRREDLTYRNRALSDIVRMDT